MAGPRPAMTIREGSTEKPITFGTTTIVMAGLVPAIHGFLFAARNGSVHL
jgi:hypothetical protein